MWVIFLVARTAQPWFKIKGILAIRRWPEMVEVRDEPEKMTPTSGTENFFGVETFLG